MKIIKLTFSGDIMLDNETRELYKTKRGMYNFDSMFNDIREFLSESDYVIGNLETPITDDYNELKNLKYQFTSPIEFAQSVKNSGFDFVSTANNHCLDNGVQGIEKTINSLNTIGLKHTGIFYKDRQLSIIDIQKIKLSILAYTYGTNAFENDVYLEKEDIAKVNMLQEQELKRRFFKKLYKSKNIFFKILKKIFSKLKLFQMQKPVFEREEKSNYYKKVIKNDINTAKKMGADYIIVCLHEGGQYNANPIKRAIKNFKFIQNSGADLIIGNHEHVIQKFDLNNIVYCLGNFLSTVGVIKEPYDKMSEYSILFHVYLSKDNKIHVVKKSFTIVKTIVDKEKSDNAIKVKLLYDLINECKDEREKNKLMIDNKKIVKIFVNKDIKINDIQKEYTLDAQFYKSF